MSKSCSFTIEVNQLEAKAMPFEGGGGEEVGVGGVSYIISYEKFCFSVKNPIVWHLIITFRTT